MSVTVTITGATGTVKKISGDDANQIDSLSDLWNNANSSNLTTPYVVPHDSYTLLLCKGSGTITIGITGDSGGTDGQGVLLGPLANAEVTAVSGSVYSVSRKYLKWNETFASAYSNANKRTAAVNDLIGDGYIVCGKSSSFSIKLTFVSDGIRCLNNDECGTTLTDPLTGAREVVWPRLE